MPTSRRPGSCLLYINLRGCIGADDNYGESRRCPARRNDALHALATFLANLPATALPSMIFAGIP